MPSCLIMRPFRKRLLVLYSVTIRFWAALFVLHSKRITYGPLWLQRFAEESFALPLGWIPPSPQTGCGSLVWVGNGIRYGCIYISVLTPNYVLFRRWHPPGERFVTSNIKATSGIQAKFLTSNKLKQSFTMTGEEPIYLSTGEHREHREHTSTSEHYQNKLTLWNFRHNNAPPAKMKQELLFINQLIYWVARICVFWKQS